MWCTCTLDGLYLAVLPKTDYTLKPVLAFKHYIVTHLNTFRKPCMIILKPLQAREMNIANRMHKNKKYVSVN